MARSARFDAGMKSRMIESLFGTRKSKKKTGSGTTTTKNQDMCWVISCRSLNKGEKGE